MPATKQTDSKGRLTLGNKFANKTVIISELSDTEIKITLGRVIPEKEAWLYANPKALAALRKGLRQARDGDIAKPVDLNAARKLADAIPEDTD